MIQVAVDAMGGDHAPDEIVAGAVMAVNARQDIRVFLVGKRCRHGVLLSEIGRAHV